MKPYFVNGTLFWDLKSIELPVSLINSEKQTTAEIWVPILGNQEPTTLRPNENFHFPFPRDFEAEARISSALFPTSLQDEKIAPIKWFIYARHMHNIYSFWQTLFPWIVSFLATNERQKLKFHFVWESPCKSWLLVCPSYWYLISCICRWAGDGNGIVTTRSCAMYIT